MMIPEKCSHCYQFTALYKFKFCRVDINVRVLGTPVDRVRIRRIIKTRSYADNRTSLTVERKKKKKTPSESIERTAENAVRALRVTRRILRSSTRNIV